MLPLTIFMYFKQELVIPSNHRNSSASTSQNMKIKEIIRLVVTVLMFFMQELVIAKQSQ